MTSSIRSADCKAFLARHAPSLGLPAEGWKRLSKTKTDSGGWRREFSHPDGFRAAVVEGPSGRLRLELPSASSDDVSDVESHAPIRRTASPSRGSAFTSGLSPEPWGQASEPLRAAMLCADTYLAYMGQPEFCSIGAHDSRLDEARPLWAALRAANASASMAITIIKHLDGAEGDRLYALLDGWLRSSAQDPLAARFCLPLFAFSMEFNFLDEGEPMAYVGLLNREAPYGNLLTPLSSELNLSEAMESVHSFYSTPSHVSGLDLAGLLFEHLERLGLRYSWALQMERSNRSGLDEWGGASGEQELVRLMPTALAWRERQALAALSPSSSSRRSASL